jgi:MarR family transcriptional regulator for hemolysin
MSADNSAPPVPGERKPFDGGGFAAAQWNDESIGRHLNLAAKSARAFHSQRLAEVGATFGTWTILASLHTVGPMIQRELAERLSIEGPTLTRHLVRMESGGLIRRERSTADRRAATVELTETGRRTYHRLAQIAVDGSAQLLRGFSADEVAQLREMLIRIQQNTRPLTAESMNDARRSLGDPEM